LLSKRLWRLLLAFALLNVAEWATVTALSVYAFQREGPLGVGLVGLRFFAAAISSATLAPLVEARRRAMVLTAWTRALLLAAIAAAALARLSLWVPLVILLVDGSVGSCYRPAQQRLIPSMVRLPGELLRSVAACSTAKTLGQAVGGTLGGIALTVSSPGLVMAAAAVIMSLAALSLLGSGSVRPSPLIASSHSVLEGLRSVPQVFGDRLLWPLVVAGTLRTLVRGFWGAMVAVVAFRLLGAGDSGVGLLQAAAGLGAVVAVPVTATQVGRRRMAAVCVTAFAASGLTVAVLGVVPVEGVALAGICGWGVAMAVSDSTSMAMLHRLLDPHSLFSTIGSMDALKSAAEGAGALLAPALVAGLGVRAALLVAGVSNPVLMVVTGRRFYAADARADGRARLVGLLHGITLFRHLDLASIEDLASRLRPVVIPAGEDLVTQGAEGDQFYVFESGEAQVLVDQYPIGQLGPGRWVGERALLRTTARTATVRAIETLRVQALDRSDFLQVMTGLELDGLELPGVASNDDLATMPVAELLEALTPLSAADGAGIEQLAARATRAEFSTGAEVFNAGDPTGPMYVVLSGHAVAVTEDGSIGTQLQPGDVFGEIAALHGTPRTRTITAADPLEVLSLPADAVLEAIGRGASGHTPRPHEHLLGVTAVEAAMEGAS
jgi:CRP-like cAMP-binding protein